MHILIRITKNTCTCFTMTWCIHWKPRIVMMPGVSSLVINLNRNMLLAKKHQPANKNKLCMITSSNGNIFRVYWPFVRGVHRSPVNTPHKGQWRGALMFSLICAWINGWVNNHEAGDLRRHCAHYDFTVMVCKNTSQLTKIGSICIQT